MDACQKDSTAVFCFGSPGFEVPNTGGLIPSLSNSCSIFFARALLAGSPAGTEETFFACKELFTVGVNPLSLGCEVFATEEFSVLKAVGLDVNAPNVTGLEAELPGIAPNGLARL